MKPEILPVEFQSDFNKYRKLYLNSEKKEPLKDILNKYEKKILQKTLEENKWNQSKAARELRISERTIRYKIENLEIKKAD